MTEPDSLSGREKAAQIRQSYLTHPGETPDVDYKAAAPFKSDDDFALDLVRHILGMANGGGGYLVIGFPEDTSGTPRPDPAMDDAVAGSYDPSPLAAYVESHILGTDKISLRVHKEPHGGKIYPIIEVEGFGQRPFFCRSTKKNSRGQEVLKNRALYIRIASARTVEVASPAEWDRLIALCVRRQQDELLGRFADLMERLGFPTSSAVRRPATPGPKERITALVAESRPIVEAELERRTLHPAYLEVAHIPTGDHRWPSQELLRVAERSVVRRTGWPIGVVLHRDEAQPKPHATGISAMIYSEIFQRSLDYWRLDQDGAYYFARTFGEDNHEGTRPGTVLAFDTRIWRVAEGFEHARVLYQNLGVNPTESIYFQFRHTGLAGRTLVASEPGRDIRPGRRNTAAPEVVWTGEATLDQIATELRELVRRVCDELFLMFDFFQLADSVLDDLLSKYLSSRI